MKLLCKCGNILLLEDGVNTEDDRFEFIHNIDEGEFIIHCTKCDRAVVLCELEEE